jgi:hypothetical protein
MRGEAGTQPFAVPFVKIYRDPRAGRGSELYPMPE